MQCIFGKLITAMITPFSNKNQVDYQKAADLAEFLLEEGSESILLSGTTGESPSLKSEEKLQLFQVVKERVGSRAKVIAATGSNSTEASLELSIKAAEIGIDGLMLVTPYYNKPPQSGLREHFKVIAESVPHLPVMLYNVPSRTGVNLTAETVIDLSKTNNIVALKEAGGDLNQVAKIIRDCTNDFSLYSGNDAETLPILSLGGKGVVSVAGHLVAKKIINLMESFFSGNHKEAALIHRELLPIFEILFISTNPLPLKAALKLLGLDTGRHRLPLNELEPDKLKILHKVLRDEGIL